MHKNAKKDAIDLAYKAGDIMRKYFTLGIKKEWKEDSSPVTEADTTINAVVLEDLRRAYPDDDILSEEGSDRREGAEYAWVCDPLDGTIPFSHGIPTSVFALALCRAGDPVLGVLYDPFMDRLFFAEKGKGATMNDTPIQVSSQKMLTGGLMNISGMEKVGGLYRVPYDLRAMRVTLAEKNIKCITLASTLYGGMLVAGGELIAAMFQGTAPHDGAAIKIIADEAGGRVTDIIGNEQKYDRPINGTLVSNGAVHDELLEIIHATLEKKV